MYSDNLKEKILIEPISQGANRLCILSGYATPSMASWHIQEINTLECPAINIDLIIGMCCTEGLSLVSHRGFLNIIDNYNTIDNFSQFNCQYVYEGPPVHTKLYLWLKNNMPYIAFTGSANYTQTAFSNRQRELITQCDPKDAINYFMNIERNSIYCTNNDVEECIRLTSCQSDFDNNQDYFESNSIDSVTLTLLSSRSEEVGVKSGLNWGQRDGREPNQAYIPVPTIVANSGFFPVNKQHFTVVTDDNKSLVLRLEQQNNKAITTPENNSRIGEYFRNRLGVANGHPVWRKDLERYGRTDVTFFKIDDEHYFMDFSV